MSNGIEIHFDDKRGYLDLACEPEAFAPYREIARQQLADFSEIPIDEVIEINIQDVENYARRTFPRWQLQDYAFIGMLIAVLGLAVVGFRTVVSWIFS